MEHLSKAVNVDDAFFDNKTISEERERIDSEVRNRIFIKNSQRNRKIKMRPMSFEIRDLVMIHTKPTIGSRKLYKFWKGPVKIIDKINDNAYICENRDGKAFKVNIRRMTKFREPIKEQSNTSMIDFEDDFWEKPLQRDKNGKEETEQQEVMEESESSYVSLEEVDIENEENENDIQLIEDIEDNGQLEKENNDLNHKEMLEEIKDMITSIEAKFDIIILDEMNVRLKSCGKLKELEQILRKEKSLSKKRDSTFKWLETLTQKDWK